MYKNDNINIIVFLFWFYVHNFIDCFSDVLENNGGKINDFECQQRENKELSIKKKENKKNKNNDE